MQTHQAAPSSYLRQSQITPGIVPVCASTLWRWVRLGKFPKPIKLSSRVTVWRAEDVQAWLTRQADQQEAA